MSNKVLASFESDDRSRCVDVFQRTDGSFGFEEYRLEFDGPNRWQSMNRFGRHVFASGALALAEAEARVPWLGSVGPWRWS